MEFTRRTMMAAGALVIAPNVVTSVSAQAQAQTVAAGRNYEELAGLPWDRGFPTPEATRTLDDELYFQRAVQTYLWSLPAGNMYAMKEAQEKIHGSGYNVVAVFEKRLRSNTVITTPNSDVIYGLGFLDLGESGPIVIEMPPKQQALIDDFWHRSIEGPTVDGVHYAADMGIPGPDKGEGGKYLIVPSNYSQPVDEKQYFVYRSKTNGVFVFLRSPFDDPNNLAPAVNRMKAIKIYPLMGQAKPMTFKDASDIPANYLAPRDGSYFELINRFIQSDRVDDVDPYMHGMLWALGIKKGRDFKPTPRQKELLDVAARTGWKMAKNIAANYETRENTLWYPDRQWIAHTLIKPDDFSQTLLDERFNDRVTGHTFVDGKALMFIDHYGASPGMTSSHIGVGAKYGDTYRDSKGEYLRGDYSYKITLPPNPPVNLFWALTVYDTETASGIQNGQPLFSVSSKSDLRKNPDGSVTIYMTPDAPPAGMDNNWVKTVPGRGWFCEARLYGPEKAFYDRTWRWGDFERFR